MLSPPHPFLLLLSKTPSRVVSCHRPSHRSFTLPPPTELYEHTKGRWLFNNAQQQAIRRVKFDVCELLRIACASVDAYECTSMSKIAEGLYNRVFRLNFDNGKSAIARIPYSPMFGSGASMITASEVATLYFTRQINVRAPRVLAWNKDPTSSVGSPFIILEDINGVQLEKDWLQTFGGPVSVLLTRVANLMHRMTIPGFSQLGSLYFTEDFPSTTVPFTSKNPGFLRVLQTVLRVGPIADFTWWRPYHDEPDFDRGPWDTVQQYIMAAVRLERRAIERHRADPASLSYTNSSLNDLIEIEWLLEKVEVLAPRLQDIIERCSPYPERFSQNVLMHPDLHAANVMVPRQTPKNAENRMRKPVLIDWQGSAILPFLLQYNIPALAEYKPRLFRDGSPLLEVNGFDEVPWPKGYDQMSPEEKDMVHAEHKIATRNVRWNETFMKMGPYAHAITFTLRPDLQYLAKSILRCCADGSYHLQGILTLIERHWNEDSWGPCPYSIDNDQFVRYSLKRENKYEPAVEKLMGRLKCNRDGWVALEDFELASRQLNNERMDWDEKTYGEPFPFEDGRWAQDVR